MLLLPPGPATRCEGQDRDLPSVLEGYKKDDFACLLKVMYPTYVHENVHDVHWSFFLYLWTWGLFDRATTLISGGNLELHLEKEEWMSVLKLSTIWNMTKVCRTQSLRPGPTDTQYLLTRSGSTRFTSCRLIKCYRRLKRSFWRERMESVHGWTKQSRVS